MQILVRLASEITTKSKPVRSRFQNRLVTNMATALKDAGCPARFQNVWSRIFVEAESSLALPVLARVPGISSLSPIDATCEPTLEAIVEKGVELYADTVRGRTFAVRARRGSPVGFHSMDIERELGGRLKPFSAGVCLDEPEVLVQVEIREGVAHFLTRVIPGPGGLPIGTGGKVLVLISGGFDSAVAAWLMLKRGLEADYLFCNLASNSYERSVLGVTHFVARMWSAGSRPVIHVVDFHDIIGNIKDKVTNRFAQVVLKRYFYRVAERIALQTGCEAIVTGESIAQVSSQTLTNLAVIDRSVEIPVMRPLIGLDKTDIIKLSRYLGTYTLCAPIEEYCSITPKNPATAARLDTIVAEEGNLPGDLIDRSLANKREMKVLELAEKDLLLPEIFVDGIGEGDFVVDCRPADQFELWHFPGAVRVDVDRIVEASREWDKGRRCVVYCALGMQSAVAAEKLQALGFRAFSLRGGAKSLRAGAEKRLG